VIGRPSLLIQVHRRFWEQTRSGLSVAKAAEAFAKLLSEPDTKGGVIASTP
jgi:hypothetical protein